MNQRRNLEGFTLIELMLAMSFVSFLLLAIAMTTIQISNIYTKGITMRSVNQVGRSVSDSLQRDIDSSSPFNVANPTNAKDTSRRYVRQFVSGNEVGGRLCLGDVSYVWNYGKYLTAAGNNVYASPNASIPIRFVRVLDSGGQLCSNPSMPVPKSNASELLSGNSSLDLVLHTFAITSTPSTTDLLSGQEMYSIKFTLGTNEQQALTVSPGSGNTQCVPPAASVSATQQPDWQYCAVNVFDLTVRASSKS